MIRFEEADELLVEELYPVLRLERGSLDKKLVGCRLFDRFIETITRGIFRECCEQHIDVESIKGFGEFSLGV